MTLHWIINKINNLFKGIRYQGSWYWNIPYVKLFNKYISITIACMLYNVSFKKQRLAISFYFTNNCGWMRICGAQNVFWINLKWDRYTPSDRPWSWPCSCRPRRWWGTCRPEANPWPPPYRASKFQRTHWRGNHNLDFRQRGLDFWQGILDFMKGCLDVSHIGKMSKTWLSV